MSDVAIRVDNLSKKYRIGGPQKVGSALLTEAVIDTLKSPLRGLRRLGQPPQPEEYIWALKDISFEVRHGEVVGIIGRNGAGKSTLLKILSRITEPTQGRAEIYGRVGSLLEVGTGFHPELTGRENIYLNGTILGMRRVEINRKFDEIVDFAGVEKFIDTPIKRYSSGMQVRLAFAVAAHLEPEILLVDEVLSVGDMAFQKKCLTKMEGVASRGRTVLFVSHQLGQISALCSRSLLLNGGAIVEDGRTGEVINTYTASLQETYTTSLRDRQERQGAGVARIVDAWVELAGGERVEHVLSGSQIMLVVQYEMSEETRLSNLQCAVGIYDSHGIWVTSIGNHLTAENLAIGPKSGRIEFVIPKLPLNSGTFTCNIMMRSGSADHKVFDWVRDAIAFTVEPGEYFRKGVVTEGSFTMVMGHQCRVVEDEDK